MTPVDQQLIREAFRLARAARQRGDRPFAALLAGPDGTVVAEATDTVATAQDPTAHAPMNVIRALRGRPDAVPPLRRATLYASAEPCAMCAAAIFWAGIGRVVFGLSVARLHDLMGRSTGDATARLAIPCRGVFAGGRPLVEVVGPVCQSEALECHRGYWQPN
jgi:tRNA(Arg) A34 adenosine deaminase TadA